MKTIKMHDRIGDFYDVGIPGLRLEVSKVSKDDIGIGGNVWSIHLGFHNPVVWPHWQRSKYNAPSKYYYLGRDYRKMDARMKEDIEKFIDEFLLQFPHDILIECFGY